MEEEAKMEQEMADARREITSKFQAVAKELETQIHQNRRQFETQVYGDIEKQILENRQQQEEAIPQRSASRGDFFDSSMQEIAAIRNEFQSILSLISSRS